MPKSDPPVLKAGTKTCCPTPQPVAPGAVLPGGDAKQPEQPRAQQKEGREMPLASLGVQDELNTGILDHIYTSLSRFGPQERHQYDQYLLSKFSRRPPRRSSKFVTEQLLCWLDIPSRGVGQPTAQHSTALFCPALPPQKPRLPACLPPAPPCLLCLRGPSLLLSIEPSSQVPQPRTGTHAFTSTFLLFLLTHRHLPQHQR